MYIVACPKPVIQVVRRGMSENTAADRITASTMSPNRTRPAHQASSPSPEYESS
jgi:hypothetical protein